MMINIFGLKFKKSINSTLKQNNRRHMFHNLENMNDVLILFSYDDWDEVYSISQDLEKKGKRVQLWTVEPKKKHNQGYVFTQNVRLISQDEFSKINGLSTSVVEEFQRLSYDTLIDLTMSDNPTMQYLLAGNKSEFCIGIKETDYNTYDFTLLKDENMNLVHAYEQIKYYLANIK